MWLLYNFKKSLSSCWKPFFEILGNVDVITSHSCYTFVSCLFSNSQVGCGIEMMLDSY